MHNYVFISSYPRSIKYWTQLFDNWRGLSFVLGGPVTLIQACLVEYFTLLLVL